MLEAILESSQPHNWMDSAIEKYASTIEILDSKVLSDELVQHLFDIQVKPSLADDLVDLIQNDEDVKESEVMKSKAGHVYGSATLLRCTICRHIAKSKCFLESVSISSKGNARWTILGNDDSFKDLISQLEKDKIHFKIKSRKKLEDRDLLTARQEQILAIAYREGFFDFPKKIGLKELSKQIGIEISTLAEILRRGQRKILRDYLNRRSMLHKQV